MVMIICTRKPLDCSARYDTVTGALSVLEIILPALALLERGRADKILLSNIHAYLLETPS